ncbi:MAG: 2-amino-4-hydroxy-6-hydroxymethyldihydropteridine diphosphokinase [Bryobacteraceae bacterium]
MKRVYLSLGSNIGERGANIEAALEKLESPRLHITRISRWYETEPQDMRDQPWFLNIVAEAETTLFPRMLLRRMLDVERKLGRRRDLNKPKGPRTIDIDILLYGSAVVKAPELDIPHPRMADRRFVLAPLADLAPDLRHPVLRKTVAELLQAVRGQEVKVVST